MTSHAGAGQTALTVEAVDNANLVSAVGSAALDVSLSPIPIGGSLGISISELTNNDNVAAFVEGATITTKGGDVVIQAVGNNTHFSESVATSVSVSLFSVAGAGGNSNIYDNANISASVDTGSSIITGNSTTGYGSLSVLANTTETLMAQMLGGSASVGSVGVFMSNATRSGSTVANMTTDGNITVGNLSVKATTNQTLTSEGRSVTVGVLAGTGETHRLYIDESIQTTVTGSGKTWSVYGNLSIGSSSTNNATAQISGACSTGGRQSENVALGLGVGFFKVISAVNPVVSTSVSDVVLEVAGSSSMGAIANSDNHATAQSGSGSLVGGEAARAITDNSPSISFTTSNLTLASGSATFLAQNCGTYTTNADSVYATVAGDSAARAYNTSNPNLTLNLGSGTAITANGSVVVKADNAVTGLGDATNMGGNTGGIMARVGGGGVVGGFGGTSVSCMTANSAVTLGDGVSILTNAQGGKILIGSSQDWNTNQLTYMHDSSGIGGAGVHSSLTSCLTNNIALGSNMSLVAPAGEVGIGTSIVSQTTADSYSYTFAIAGGSRSVAENNLTSCQTVTVGDNSTLRAAGDISITAGTDPVSGKGTLQDTYSTVTAHGTGIAVPGTDADAVADSTINVTIGEGSQIISDRDVDLGATPGINNAQWYTFANMDGAKGNTHTGTDGLTETSNVTINGDVIAGYSHLLDINIPESGDTATVNGQTVSLPNSNGVLTNITPLQNSAFLPFQAGYNTNYNTTQLLDGLAPTSRAILSKSISTTPVDAITLRDLVATGGQVVIHADSLSGNANISAYVPNITINNDSSAYLILDGIAIPNTLNMGKISVVGNACVPEGITLNQQTTKPSVTINENYGSAVGSGTASGPAIAITGPIVNTGGSVSIFNAEGALVQDAPINAIAVTINTPNSAYIVNTPTDYYGTGGVIRDYWENTSTIFVQNGGFESPGIGSGSSAYQYNPSSSDIAWTFSPSSGISGNDSGFTSRNPNAPAGSQVAFIQEKGVISQPISGLVAGQTYELSFAVAQRDGYPNQSFDVTLGNQSLVSNLTPSSTNYTTYSYSFTAQSSGNQTLTFTGLEPTGQDETVFLDQVTISPSPSVITPGLNSYVYQYTANLAATTAANILYLYQSGTNNSIDFSNWLYNTSGVSISDFTNTNVSPSNIGSYYPKKASDNWDTTEYGSGIIFFGSEIPYFWQNGSATIASGSGSLTGGSLGYFDTLANAQYWSQAASGNPADSYLNVTQGTGPQNDSVNPGRGIYPVVPTNFPTEATITNPQNVTLGNGINAGQLDVTALYIDINALVNVGVYNSGFEANLSASLGDYIQSQVDENSSLACVPIPASYLGGSNTSLTAYYDVLANQIVLSPVAINAGVVSAIFKGGIISTTNQGKVTVTSNPGQNLIENQSGYPLVIQGISAAESKLAGLVQFNDTLTNLSTAYVYRGDNQVDMYQGPLGPLQGANLTQLKLVGSSSGTSATFSPAENLAYEWTQEAYISRDLKFTNDNNSYTLDSNTNDLWSWGALQSDGTAPTNYTSAIDPFSNSSNNQSPNQLILTDGVYNTETAIWYQQPVSIPTTGTFTVDFTYQASGARAADGITLAFQTEGINAIGQPGGGLGYVGIIGPTAAYQINLYNAGGSHVPGSNFVTTNTSGSYNSTNLVSFPSGHAIRVSLVFDANANTVTETLTDTTTNATYQHVYDNVDLASVLGSQAYLGFTGGDGGATSIQTVSNFSLTTPTQTISGFGGFQSSSQGNVLELASPINSYTQQVTALITQSESATTYFSSNNQDAWNFGPSTQWTWMYPTEILLRIKNQLPACNPIPIDFSGVQYGSLGINSSSSLTLDGNIQFPGSVSLNAGGNISQASGAVIAANQLEGLTATGAIGTATSPLNLSIATGSINAQAATGLYLSSSHNLTIGSVAADDGPVQLQSSNGSIVGSGTSTNVSGTELTLLAANGSVGTQLQPIQIQTQTTQLPTGSVSGGLFSATANNAIFVTQATGDLRIASVTTTSPVGVVSITNLDGNITDGNIPDAFVMNNGSLSPAMIGHVIDSMRQIDQNMANLTIASFEGSVDSSYLQYWTALQNGSITNGDLTLTANGVLYYQPNANLYYANTANQTSNATEAQVNSYADMLYDNAINTFENNMAFGPDWATLPQFQSYNANYTFTASNQTISELTYSAFDLSYSFAMLSLDALSPKGSELLGNTTAPAIETAVLNLKASGSIGLTLAPLEINLDSIRNGTLTPQEKLMLTLATNAGELQMIGTNAEGQRVVYSYGSEPSNVTPTGVIVQIEKPLFVNVANEGLVQIQASGTINLTGTQGNLNILNISSPDNVRLVSQQNISEAKVGTSAAVPGWSIVNGTLGFAGNGSWTASSVSVDESTVNQNGAVISAENLRLVSGNTIGSVAQPIAIQVNGKLDGYAYGDLYLEQTTGDLMIGSAKSGGAIQIDAPSGSIYATDNDLKGSMASFGSDGTGWNLKSANGTVSVSDNFMTFTNNAITPDAGPSWYSNESAWYDTAMTVDNSFIASFLYQSADSGSSLSFVLLSSDELNVLQNDLDKQVTASDVKQSITFTMSQSQPGVSPSFVGFFYNGALNNVQIPSDVNLSSNDPIQVLLIYNHVEKAITVSLTDTVTNQSFSFINYNIDMLKLLGTTQANVGFLAAGTGQESTQTVSGFSFSYGEPTIKSQSLNMLSGGTIGTSTQPILTLVSGGIQATAPDGVFLLQTDGNLVVDSIASAGNISLSAPTGSVVNSSSGGVQSSGGITAAIQLTSLAPRPAGIHADTLSVNALNAIGALGKPLDISVLHLSAATVLSDIEFGQTGPLTIDGGVQSGGAVNILGDSAIVVTSAIQSGSQIHLETLSSMAGESRLALKSGASVIASGGSVILKGGDGVSLNAGSTVGIVGSSEISNVEITSMAYDQLVNQAYDLDIRGAIIADQINFQSASGNRNNYLNIGGISGRSGIPKIDFRGAQGIHGLTVDDSAFSTGRRVTFDNSQIQTEAHQLQLSAIDHVLLNLGSGNDSVKVGGNTGLQSLDINSGAGADLIETVLSTSESLSQNIDTGTDSDILTVHAENQMTWASPGQIQTANTTLVFKNVENINVDGTPVMNAMPISVAFDSLNANPDVTTNIQYVQYIYQQVLNRNATAQELLSGSRLLDRNMISRLQFANRIINSNESITLQVNAWYMNYLGRESTGVERRRALLQLRSGQSQERILSQILTGQEFNKRTQNLVNNGNPLDRYITGLYKLSVDPSGEPSAQLMQHLRLINSTGGRTRVALEVLRSAPIAQNKAEALSIINEHSPLTAENRPLVLGRSGLNGLRARMLSRRS